MLLSNVTFVNWKTPYDQSLNFFFFFITLTPTPQHLIRNPKPDIPNPDPETGTGMLLSNVTFVNWKTPYAQTLNPAPQVRTPQPRKGLRGSGCITLTHYFNCAGCISLTQVPAGVCALRAGRVAVVRMVTLC